VRYKAFRVVSVWCLWWVVVEKNRRVWGRDSGTKVVLFGSQPQVECLHHTASENHPLELIFLKDLLEMWLVYWESIMLPHTQSALLRRELWGFWIFVAIITVKERTLLLYMNIELTESSAGDCTKAVLTDYPIGCVGIMDVISSQSLALINIVCHFVLKWKSMILARNLEHLVN